MVKFAHPATLLLLSSFFLSAFSASVEELRLGEKSQLGEERASELAASAGIIKLKTDFDSVAHYVSVLDESVAKVSTTLSIPQAYKISANFKAVQKGLAGTAKDIKATPRVSTRSAKELIVKLRVIEKDVAHLLATTISKKKSFAGIHLNVMPLIRKALKAMEGDADEMMDALVKIVPGEMRTDVAGINERMTAAFEKAVTAYSS
ncbi:hypothetical protein AX17_005491 [Amanita inopinata Kibby_2008]|nr:hypothetical protein AX17_005491 [Amanita inopinata Kibby_2008]